MLVVLCCSFRIPIYRDVATYRDVEIHTNDLVDASE